MYLLTGTVSAAACNYVAVTVGSNDTLYAEVDHHAINGERFCTFESGGIRYCAFEKNQYIIERVPNAPENFTDRFVTGTKSAEKPSHEYLAAMYGLNRMKIEAVDAFTVSIQEIVSPFYLFQYFAVAIWLYTDYVIYSVIVLFITLMSIIFCVKSKLFNLKRLHDLAGSEHPVEMYDLSSNTKPGVKSDQKLIPGDCFMVTAGMSVPCDAILVRGRVVVDESMLTGESVPVTKTEFQYSSTDSDATRRTANILYSGTTVKIVNAGSDAIAMVYKTGFRSARGELIAALITPKQEIVQFLPDAMLAILFMVIITTAIFGWSADQLKKIGTTDGDVVIAYLTALTIAVPPGLVACLSIGISIAVARLALKNITITDTGKLNAAGYCSNACFDKAGTLTDENIVFQGVQLYRNGAALAPADAKSPSAGSSVEEDNVAVEIMACCHSLSLVEGKPEGDPLEVELFTTSKWALSVSRDSKYSVAIPPANRPNGGQDHLIVKQFEFTPEKLRAGTLVLRPTGTAVFLLKGSPEMIVTKCNASTVPASLTADMSTLAKQGFRVLALAYRIVRQNVKDASEISSLSQEELEATDVSFLGLVYFSNKLKRDTFPATISSLKAAAIHVNMITGDHYHTAVAISQDCHILEKDVRTVLIDALEVNHVEEEAEAKRIYQLVIKDLKTDQPLANTSLEDLITQFYSGAKGGKGTQVATIANGDVEMGNKAVPIGGGEAFQVVMTGAGFKCVEKNHPELLEALSRITSVFARMKPSSKKKVVEELMITQPAAMDKMASNQFVKSDTGSHVVFCGDGANDMEALSTATVGVSLCDTATTVAAAIVSTNQTPFAVVEVLKEGRCSLITAYVLVNYNIMYAIIQLFMTCYLNNVGLVFGDYMYLVQDMFFSLFLGLCIGYTDPSDTLQPRLPPQSLFTPGLMAKLLIQLAIFPIFQYITLIILYDQRWFTKFDAGDDPLNESYANEGAALNLIALAQLDIASVVVTIGEPFRKPWYTNKTHIFVMICHTTYILYLMFGEDNAFMVGLDNKPAPHRFQGILIGIIAANIFVSAIATKLADYFF